MRSLQRRTRSGLWYTWFRITVIATILTSVFLLYISKKALLESEVIKTAVDRKIDDGIFEHRQQLTATKSPANEIENKNMIENSAISQDAKQKETNSPTSSIKAPVYLTLDLPNGRLCNQLLTLSTALERARLRPEVTLVLWGKWTVFEHLLDWERVRNYVGGRIETRADKPRDMKWTSAWWDRACAERVSRPSIRDAIRPSASIRNTAESSFKNLKEQGAKQVLALHRRDMEGSCYERTKNPFKYGIHCHHSSNTFQGKLNQCNYLPGEAFKTELLSQYPDLDFNGLGLFLSSDGLDKQGDLKFREVFPLLLESDKMDDPTSMLRDMWVSTLSDFYVGNTMSSCEGIVAQWRMQHHGTNVAPVYPKSCFEGFNFYLDEIELCGPNAKWDFYF